MSFKLGTDSYIGDNTVVKYWKNVPESESTVHVGNYCSIAGDVRFFVDGNHNYNYASTFPFYELGTHTGQKSCWGKGAPKVGHDVWIGEGCLILSGVTIGNGAVVCARSVVTKDVPPYAIVAGNPGVVKKYRFDDETIQALLDSEWWNLPRNVVYSKLVPVQSDVKAWIEACIKARM